MYLLVFTSRVKAHLMLFNKSKFCDKDGSVCYPIIYPAGEDVNIE